eukprot:TRINITY_DN3465_c1_g1_i2.p1 TRINITY_DN3465_c1_g1~~TRINITY_DN3465_c1_g1_i2.p1  ORF type:complete len:132 (+),score=24.63 TRINITY_DN3465_c1_g1_i2:739-1134(+)
MEPDSNKLKSRPLKRINCPNTTPVSRKNRKPIKRTLSESSKRTKNNGRSRNDRKTPHYLRPTASSLLRKKAMEEEMNQKRRERELAEQEQITARIPRTSGGRTPPSYRRTELRKYNRDGKDRTVKPKRSQT